MPGDSIAIHLQKLQQLLGLLSVPGLLLSRERVVGDQQGMGPTPWGQQRLEVKGQEGMLLSLRFLQLRTCTTEKVLTMQTSLADAGL